MKTLTRFLFALILALLAACIPIPAEPTPPPPPTVRPYCAATTTRAIGLWRDLNLTGLGGELGKDARVAVYLDLDATRYWSNGTLAAYVTAWFGGAEGWLFLNNAPITWDDAACPGDRLAALGIPWPLPELAAPQTASSIDAPEGMCAILWPCEWLVTPGAVGTPEPPTATPTPTDTPTDAPTAILTASPTPTYTYTPTLSPIPLTEAPTATPTTTPTIDYEWQTVTTLYTLRLRAGPSTSESIRGEVAAGEQVRVSRVLIVYAPLCEDTYFGSYIWATTDGGDWMAIAVMSGDPGRCLLAEWWVDPPFDFGFYGFPTPTPESFTPGPTMTPDAVYAGCIATAREGHRLVWQPGQSTPFPMLLNGTYVPVRGACCKEGSGLWYLIEIGEVYRLAHDESIVVRGCPALEACSQ